MSDPLAYTTTEACRAIGIGRTTLYTLIGTGRLKAVKLGGTTLVPADALRTFVAELPTADIRTGCKVAA